jgi:hypothetical protein
VAFGDGSSTKRNFYGGKSFRNVSISSLELIVIEQTVYGSSARAATAVSSRRPASAIVPLRFTIPISNTGGGGRPRREREHP